MSLFLALLELGNRGARGSLCRSRGSPGSSRRGGASRGIVPWVGLRGSIPWGRSIVHRRGRGTSLRETIDRGLVSVVGARGEEGDPEERPEDDEEDDNGHDAAHVERGAVAELGLVDLVGNNDLPRCRHA